MLYIVVKISLFFSHQKGNEVVLCKVTESSCLKLYITFYQNMSKCLRKISYTLNASVNNDLCT